MAMEKQLIAAGSQSLLDGDFERSRWLLDTVVLLDPGYSPTLWQRGICLYYMNRFTEAMQQFETDMDANGGDIEEVLWHFISKCGRVGFDKATKDGFIPLKATNNSPPPMNQVLLMYKGIASPEAVIASATGDNNLIIQSYNGMNALAYAHYYVGLYYQLRSDYNLARLHLEKACQFNATDYMGKVMQLHYKLFMRTTTGLRMILPSFKIGYQKSPKLISGGWQLSTGHEKSEKYLSQRIANMLEIIEYGVTAFDCGDIYTGVEEILGKMLNTHILYGGGTRESLCFHTKLVPDLDVIKQMGVTDDYVRGVIRRSLNRLGTNYLDLVQFHWWDMDYHGYVEALKCLIQLQEEGTVKEIGLTNFSYEHTKELIDAGIRISSTQVQLSVLDQRPISSGLLDLCLQNNISLMAYGVLAGGFLTDKWIGKPPPSEMKNISLVKYYLIIEEFGGWEKFQYLLKTLQSIASNYSPLKTELSNGKSIEIEHVTVAMVAIAYVLQLPGVGGVILGSLNAERTKQSIVASNMILSAVDIKQIHSVTNGSPGPHGDVYQLERIKDGRHSAIMKYNLNQLNKAPHLEELCRRYVELMFSAYPVEATRSGYCHTKATLAKYCLFNNYNISTSSELYDKMGLKGSSYDHRLDVSNKSEVEEFLVRVECMAEEIADIDKDSLNVDQQIDLELIDNQLQLELVKWRELRHHEKDPSMYLPFDAINYLLPNWGSPHDLSVPLDDSCYKWEELSHPGVTHLSPVLRLLAILWRLRQLPYTLLAGKENLVQPVKVFVERAVGMCNSFMHFLESDFENLVNIIASYEKSLESELVNTLVEEVIFASKVAMNSIANFKAFIETRLRHSATDCVAIGNKTYDKLLKLDHMIPDSTVLLTLGLDHFKTVKHELEQLAAKIAPGKTWQEITKDIIRSSHPKANGLLQAYMDEIYRAKDHMIKFDLMPRLPEGEKVIGIHTPSCLLSFSPFGDFLNPSSFAGMAETTSSKKHAGYLMLHPVGTRGFTPDEEEELLRSHDYSWIKVIAPHECYPGHHVQSLLTQSNSRILRKYYQSAYFYEGWGLYCEQLAYETGFFAERESTTNLQNVPEKFTRLTQLRLQLWRAARVILDVRLHKGDLTFQECVEFLCSEVMFDSSSAVSEVTMYATRPTYAPCYITGLIKILEYRQKEEQRCKCENKLFQLREFHAKLLAGGPLPFLLINKLIDN